MIMLSFVGSTYQFLIIVHKLEHFLYPWNRHFFNKHFRQFYQFFLHKTRCRRYSYSRLLFLNKNLMMIFLVSHQCHTNIHNHRMWNMAYNLCNISWNIQSITQNLFHLFDQSRITNIIRVDIRFDKKDKYW